MENCFVRFNVRMVCVTLGFLLYGSAVAMGDVGNISNLPSRSDVGLGNDENFITPSIAVSEEYTDNVFGTPSDKVTDFITHVTPGIALKYRAPFWDWDLTYLLDYRYFARNSENYDFDNDLNAKGNLRIIKDFLFLDLNETYKRISLDINRNTTLDTPYANQVDQNIVTVAPHIEFHPGANFLVKSGYHYTNETYTNASLLSTTTTPLPIPISSEGVNYEEQGAFITTSHELTQRSTFTTNFYYTHVSNSLDQIYNQYCPTLGVRYEYADKSFISLEGGYTWFLFENGSSRSAPYWNVEISHEFGYMTAKLDTLVKYNSDPLYGSTEERDFKGNLDKKLQRGSFGVSVNYTEIRDNQQDTLISKWLAIGGNIKHDLTEKLAGHLELSGEKVIYDINNLNNDIITPYRFFIATGLSYLMANNLTLSLDYNYTTYRQSIDSAANNTEINKVFVGMKKVF